MKEAMCQTPVLALPNFDEPFVLETDACQSGIGAVVRQNGRPIVYLSKSLAPKHMGLSTYEKELLAVLSAVKKWHHYLIGRKFVIRSDYQSLKHLKEQRVTTILQQKWLTRMFGYQYEVAYKMPMLCPAEMRNA